MNCYAARVADVTLETAARILTQHRHRDCVRWYARGEWLQGEAEPDCSDPFDVLTKFEAIAIAEKYLREPPTPSLVERVQRQPSR